MLLFGTRARATACAGAFCGAETLAPPRSSAAGTDGWRPARPRNEAEGVAGRVGVDMLAGEFLCSEGEDAGLC